MRILLLTDTHGQLGPINALAREVGAEAVLHAGDFGFYDDASVDRLSERELRLHLVHGRLPETLPAGSRKVGRHGPEPLWFRDVFSINLPDAAQGHALLTVEDGRSSLEPRSRGMVLPRAPR